MERDAPTTRGIKALEQNDSYDGLGLPLNMGIRPQSVFSKKISPVSPDLAPDNSLENFLPIRRPLNCPNPSESALHANSQDS